MNNDKHRKLASGNVQTAIENALSKLSTRNESDICRYLPVSTGGYMHHFTFRKMKREEPEKLIEMIDKNINSVAKPKPVPHKPRAARGSRKNRDRIVFSRADLDSLLHMARIAGNEEMIRKLTRNQDVKTIKRELISAIRHDKFERAKALWNSYGEMMSSQNFLSENAKS